MNAQTQTLKDLCFNNPALRSLLQFDAVNSTEIAELTSSNIHFSILYSKEDDNFLLHYRCHNHRPAWENSPEGYVRCNNFEEVLEAINEEIHEHHLHRSQRGKSSPIQKILWIGLQPRKIATKFRFIFSKALDEAISLTCGETMPPRLASHFDQWTVFLHRLALSA